MCFFYLFILNIFKINLFILVLVFIYFQLANLVLLNFNELSFSSNICVLIQLYFS